MNILGNETTMDSANNYIDDTVVKRLGVSPAPAGTIIFPKIGAAVATNKKRLLSLPSAYDNNVMGLIPSEKIISRFLFYWMQTINLSTLANDSGAVPSIRKSSMETHVVPIPCPNNPEKSLAIQAEIVRILDTFTELTTEQKINIICCPKVNITVANFACCSCTDDKSRIRFNITLMIITKWRLTA
jgi:type I restriction enzyme S subunit